MRLAALLTLANIENMASINYLWRNRAVFTLGSVNFYRAWAKRVLSLPELLTRNYKHSTLLAKGASIHEQAEIGHVTIDGPRNLLQVGAQSFLGRVYIALHDKVQIGERVCINDGVCLLTASHDVMDPAWSHTKAAIVISDYVWIGTNAMILPGVHLGRGAVVGAGAVVTKSVPAGGIVVGNPAKQLAKTRTEQLTYNPCEFLSANRAWLLG
jgi:acetyltransferase-like isoleucine patch superfamily enzyme